MEWRSSGGCSNSVERIAPPITWLIWFSLKLSLKKSPHYIIAKLAYSLYWTAAAAVWSNSAEVWHSWASSARLLHEEELNSQWTMKVIVDAKEEASFAQCLEDTDDRLLLHILFTYLARERAFTCEPQSERFLTIITTFSISWDILTVIVVGEYLDTDGHLHPLH